MRYVTLAPSPALAHAVEMFWAYEGYQPPCAYERVFPSGTVELLLNLTDGRLRCYDPETGRLSGSWSGILVAGVHRRFQLVDTAQQYAMLGVALRPGGAWSLLGVDASELSDRHVPLEALVGAEAGRWVDQVWGLGSPLARLRWLDRMLTRHVQRTSHPAVAWATEQIEHYPDSARIHQLADESGLSARRFQALFQREIGIAPKAYASIRRFQATLTALRTPRACTLAALAVAHGYADQAHMIREFKTHSGYTPTGYRALMDSQLRHVPHAERDQMCPDPRSSAAASLVADGDAYEMRAG